MLRTHVVAAAAALGVFAGAACATTVFVDQSRSASGAGGAWTTAFVTVQEALTYARAHPLVTSICVAQGTYTPVAGHTSSFELVSNVAMYGGYDSSTGLCDPDRYITTLSGLDTANHSRHYTVVSCNVTGSATLNGFHISDASSYSSDGGGIYVRCGRLYLNHCVVENNQANYGGGIYVSQGGRVSITASDILNNFAFEDGGGIYCCQEAVLEAYSCVFRANRVNHNGGACYLYETSAWVSNCTIAYNTAAHYCGGFYSDWVHAFPPVQVENSILWGNTAAYSPQAWGLMDMLRCDLESPSANWIGGVRLWTLDADPQFWSSTNLRLASSSPCVDTGYNSMVRTSWDRDGVTRIQRSCLANPVNVDLGAYERSFSLNGR